MNSDGGLPARTPAVPRQLEHYGQLYPPPSIDPRRPTPSLEPSHWCGPLQTWSWGLPTV